MPRPTKADLLAALRVAERALSLTPAHNSHDLGPSGVLRQVRAVIARANPVKPRREWERKRFTLDGVRVDLAELAAVNDLDPDTLNRIGALEVGQAINLGGGAAAYFVLRRTL